MEWEKDKPLFGEEVEHPIATIDLEWEKEKHLFGKEIKLGCRCSLCIAPGPLPRREPVNYQETIPGVFEPFESIAFPRATTNPGRSTPSSRSAGQFLPQSNSIPAPSHSTNPGAKATSALTPRPKWLQTVVNLGDKFTGVPPPLPPSVEEAYRRKCIQLKQRMNEVEEANDASRQRLARLNRQIQKMRLERAFLLEQLAKRTSTNVEDSEGSPSPPPTPKEKPLRTKRGHRKPEFLSSLGDGSAGSAFIQQGPVTLSPSSDAFSHTHPDPSQTIRTSTPQAQTQTSKRQLPNGHKYAAPGHVPPKSSPERAPKNAFDLYCKDMRSVLAERHTKEIADGSFDIEGALARGWSALDEEGRGEFLRKFEQVKKAAEVEKEVGAGGSGGRQALFDAESRNADEDVEMAEDGDDVDTASGEGGGFTAVNRG